MQFTGIIPVGHQKYVADSFTPVLESENLSESTVFKKINIFFILSNFSLLTAQEEVNNHYYWQFDFSIKTIIKYIRSNCHLFSLLLSFLMQIYPVAKYVVQFCNTNFRKCPFIWFMSKNRKILWQLRIYADSNLELFFHSLLIYNTLQNH